MDSVGRRSMALLPLVVLFTIVILFLGAVSGYFLGNLAFDRSSDTYGLTLAAFLGAFFAFVLSAIAGLAMELEKRERRGHLALVYLERYFNSVLPSIGGLQDLIKHQLDTIAKGGWSPFSLHNLPEPVEDRWGDIAYQGTLNRVFALLMRIQEINRNARNFNDWYRSIKERPNKDEMPDDAKRADQILRNLQRYSEELSKLLPVIVSTENVIVRVVAEIRIVKRRRTPLMSLLSRIYLGTNSVSVSNSDVDAEVITIQRERISPKLSEKEDGMSKEGRAPVGSEGNVGQEKAFTLALHNLIESKFKDYRTSGIALSVTLVSLSSALIVWANGDSLSGFTEGYFKVWRIGQTVSLGLAIAASILLQFANYQGYKHEARAHAGQSEFSKANDWFTREDFAVYGALLLFLVGVASSIVFFLLTR